MASSLLAGSARIRTGLLSYGQHCLALVGCARFQLALARFVWVCSVTARFWLRHKLTKVVIQLSYQLVMGFIQVMRFSKAIE